MKLSALVANAGSWRRRQQAYPFAKEVAFLSPITTGAVSVSDARPVASGAPAVRRRFGADDDVAQLVLSVPQHWPLDGGWMKKQVLAAVSPQPAGHEPIELQLSPF